MNVLSKKLIKLHDLINITDIRTISCNLRDKDDYDMYIIAEFLFHYNFYKIVFRACSKSSNDNYVGIIKIDNYDISVNILTKFIIDPEDSINIRKDISEFISKVLVENDDIGAKTKLKELYNRYVDYASEKSGIKTERFFIYLYLYGTDNIDIDDIIDIDNITAEEYYQYCVNGHAASIIASLKSSSRYNIIDPECTCRKTKFVLSECSYYLLDTINKLKELGYKVETDNISKNYKEINHCIFGVKKCYYGPLTIIEDIKDKLSDKEE